MLSRSPHFSSSNSQLWGAQPIPHRTPISQPPLSLFLLRAAAQQALGLLISIHLPDPLASPLSLQPAPQLLTGTPPVLSHHCPGVPLSPCPRLCAKPSEQCHPVSVASGASLLLSIPGHRLLGAPPFGVLFPRGHPRCPCLACLGTTLASHPACRAPAAHPALGLLPFPSAQHRGGPWGDTGEQTATLPSPAPTGYGTHSVPFQPWFGLTSSGHTRLGQAGEARVPLAP